MAHWDDVEPRRRERGQIAGSWRDLGEAAWSVSRLDPGSPSFGEHPGGAEEAFMVADEVTRRILATYEAGDLITMCAWCRQVEIDDEWVPAPRAALTAIDALYTLSHSICPGCAAAGPTNAIA